VRWWARDGSRVGLGKVPTNCGESWGISRASRD